MSSFTLFSPTVLDNLYTLFYHGVTSSLSIPPSIIDHRSSIILNPTSLSKVVLLRLGLLLLMGLLWALSEVQILTAGSPRRKWVAHIFTEEFRPAKREPAKIFADMHTLGTTGPIPRSFRSRFVSTLHPDIMLV